MINASLKLWLQRKLMSQHPKSDPLVNRNLEVGREERAVVGLELVEVDG
jgi:hypothetical protein